MSKVVVYDVIVVGAGPAGSTVAWEIAALGFRTLLLDKASFPRDKPCGGGLAWRTVRLIPFDLGPISEGVIHSARFTFYTRPFGPARGSHTFVRRYREPLALMTQRCRLDALLAQEACRRGADFHDGEGVRGIEVDSDGVTVKTARGSYRGRALVGADGANGIVTRAAGLERPREATVGLEGKLAPPPEALLAWRKTVAFQLGVLPWGYGWLFPKGDHLNVGLWQRGAAPRREELAALVRRLGFDPRALAEVRGHLLPLGRPGTPLVRGPVLLVGDAAGLADPLTGEGIYGAVRSGQMAARALSCYLSGEARDLSPYQEEVDGELLADLQVARQIRDIFYRRPELFLFLLARSRRLWEALCRLVRGDTSYRAFKGKLGPLAPLFDGAAALARPRR